MKRRRQQSKTKYNKRNQPVLLDQFSDSDIRTWSKFSQDCINFEYNLFFALEAQRASFKEQITEALRENTNLNFELSNWIRLLDYKYSLEPLSSKGSLTGVGGRFNFGSEIDSTRFVPFNALYIAQDFETAFREKFVLSREQQVNGLTTEELALQKPTSLTIISIAGKLHNIFDLNNPNSLKSFIKITQNFNLPESLIKQANQLKSKPPKLIKSTKALLNSLLEPNWRRQPMQYDIPANCQIFGKLLFDAGFDGVCYPSTRSQKNCLALFPSNWTGSQSQLYISGTPPSKEVISKLDSSTFMKLL